MYFLRKFTISIVLVILSHQIRAGNAICLHFDHTTKTICNDNRSMLDKPLLFDNFMDCTFSINRSFTLIYLARRFAAEYPADLYHFCALLELFLVRKKNYVKEGTDRIVLEYY